MEAAIQIPASRVLSRGNLDIDEIVASVAIESDMSRTQSRMQLFDELGVEVITHRLSDDWWIALAYEQGWSWESCLRQCDLREIYSEAVAAARQAMYTSEQYDPDHISDFALPKLVSIAVQALEDSPQVIAATEEDAEMGLLALLLDGDEEKYFLSDVEVCQLYPADPRPDLDCLNDIWRDFIAADVIRLFEDEISDIDRRESHHLWCDFVGPHGDISYY